jgi:pyridoxamine 5'-phosphate oxidase
LSAGDGDYRGGVSDEQIPASQRLAMMRRTYRLHGLDERDLAPTWSEMLERWLDDADRHGVLEPNAMVVATASADGRPNARTVLLKGLDETSLTFFTNYASAKGRELAENPMAAVLFPWVDLQRQVRLVGPVRRLDPAASDAYFATRPYGSRVSAVASPQSAVVPDRAALEAARAEVAARYPDEVPRPDGWGGYAVVPDTVEFWQGREDRLHDRLVYRREENGAWVVERLGP